MAQEGFDLQFYLHILRKRLWMIAIISVLVVVVITIKTYRQTPIYETTAQLLLERRAPNIVSFREVMAQDTAGDYYETQYKLLKSSELARQTLQQLGMVDQTTPEETKQKLIRKILRSLTISPVKDSRLVDVIVKSPNPEQSAQWANALVDAYIKQDLDIKLSASKNAADWLGQQLKIAQDKMANSASALLEYKEKHEIVSFQERENIVLQGVSQLNEAVNRARIRRVTTEAEYRQIQQYPKTKLQALSHVRNDPLIQRLKIELSRLESEYSELQKSFREKHPNIIALKSQIASIQERIDTETERVITNIKTDVRNEYDVALEQEQELETLLDQQKREALDLSHKAVKYEELEREAESNRGIYNTLLQRAKETSITEQLETSNIRVVERARATVPYSPISPNKKQNLLLSLIIGPFIGIALAFFFESLDSSIKTPEDVTQCLDSPFLGVIPKVSPKNILPHEERPAKDVIVGSIVILAPGTIASEAYKSLRTKIRFLSNERGSVKLVTSAGAEEGKSGIVANLGIALALSGRKTLIIDCDLRQPVIHQIFALKHPENGFTGLFKKNENSQQRPQIEIQPTSIKNLDIIAGGEIPPNPSEILGSELTKRTIESLREEYDEILIDSPPVNEVTDPLILSRIADGVIFTIRSGKTKQEAVLSAIEQLNDVGATILGGILNDVDISKDRSYYGYQYTHYQKKGNKIQKLAA